MARIKTSRAKVLDRYRESGSPTAASLDWSLVDAEEDRRLDAELAAADAVRMEEEERMAEDYLMEEEALIAAFQDSQERDCPICSEPGLQISPEHLACPNCRLNIRLSCGTELDAEKLEQGVKNALSHSCSSSSSTPNTNIIFYPHWTSYGQELVAFCRQCRFSCPLF